MNEWANEHKINNEHQIIRYHMKNWIIDEQKNARIPDKCQVKGWMLNEQMKFLINACTPLVPALPAEFLLPRDVVISFAL